METKKQYYQQKKAVPEPTYAPATNSKSQKMQDGKRAAQTHDQLFARQKEYEERRKQQAELKEAMETKDMTDVPTRDTAVPKDIEERVAAKRTQNVVERLHFDAEKF